MKLLKEVDENYTHCPKCKDWGLNETFEIYTEEMKGERKIKYSCLCIDCGFSFEHNFNFQVKLD
jgi:hypothetical protein